MSGSGPKITQEKPTQPRPTDAAGRQLDQWGLPFSGPARVRRLAELNKPDPNVDPASWAPVPRRGARKLDEGEGQSNGEPEAGSSAGAGAGQSAPVAPGVVTEKSNG